jgi:hypothetical protein
LGILNFKIKKSCSEAGGQQKIPLAHSTIKPID